MFRWLMPKIERESPPRPSGSSADTSLSSRPPPTDDELLAAAGLSPKLFLHQVPEQFAFADAVEKLVILIECFCPRGLWTKAVARGIVVLRVIRGKDGIVWAAQRIAEEHMDCLIFVSRI